MTNKQLKCMYVFQFGRNQSRLLAEKTRMRLQYDEAQRKLGELKCRLAKIEDKMVPGQPESDKDRSVFENSFYLFI